MKTAKQLVLALSIFGGSAGYAVAARADAATADAHFKEGRRLLQGSPEEVAKACTLFRASHREEPSVGALLNLGLCQEKRGKLAAAARAFEAAISLVQANRHDDVQRGELAERRLGELKPKLVQVSFDVADLDKLANVVIKVDDDEVPRSHWVQAAADRGSTVVVATADGMLQFEKSFDTTAPKTTIPVVFTPKPIDANPTAPPRTTDTRTAGYIVGGIGLAAIATGGLFGKLASDQKSKSAATCRDDNVCPEPGFTQRTTAIRYSDFATAFIAGGVAVTGVGVYLVLRKPRPSAPEASAIGGIRVSSTPLVGGAQLSLSGAW